MIAKVHRVRIVSLPPLEVDRHISARRNGATLTQIGHCFAQSGGGRVDGSNERQLIRHLEDALALADEIEDGQTGFLIERALDEARSRHFRPIG
jgi:hypothetical protein